MKALTDLLARARKAFVGAFGAGVAAAATAYQIDSDPKKAALAGVAAFAGSFVLVYATKNAGLVESRPRSQ